MNGGVQPCWGLVNEGLNDQFEYICDVSSAIAVFQEFGG